METDNPTMDFMHKYCRKAMKWTGYLDWIEKNVNYGFILKNFKEVNRYLTKMNTSGMQFVLHLRFKAKLSRKKS